MADDNIFVLREVFAKVIGPFLGQTWNLSAMGSDETKLAAALEALYNPSLSKLTKFEPEVVRHENGSFTLQVRVPKGAEIDHKALWEFVNSGRLAGYRAPDALQIASDNSLSYTGAER